jgi:tRNA-specific 2-thiouridylase
MVNMAGEIVGEHQGYARYTVGQRRGLGGGARQPLYVIGVRAPTGEVVVGTAADLNRSDILLGDLNWIAEPPVAGERVAVQIRHQAAPVAARVERITDGETLVLLEIPQRAVTPGQSGVIYRDNQLLGGGRIR